MNAYIFERSLETLTLIILCLCFISIMVAALYDIIRVNKRQRLPRVLQKQPHITVLVYAKNNAATISTCLKSIMKSTYRHFDVVVTDDGSKDATSQEAKRVQRDLKQGSLRVYKKRKAASTQKVLEAAYQKSKKGELVLVVSGDTIIGKTFLRQCAGEFRAFPAEAIKLNTHYEVATNLGMVVPRFQQLGRHLQMKLSSLFHIEKNQGDDTSVLYTQKAFRQLQKSKVAVSYRGHLVVELLQRPKVLSAQHRSLVSTLGVGAGIALATYATYLAISIQNVTLLLFSWLGVCLWFLGALWLDEAEKIEGKLKLTFTLPPLYVFMYITGLLQLVGAPIRTFFNRG